MINNLKLTTELVPETSWFKSLREVVSRSVWDKLRKQTYAEYGYKCGVCGAEGRLNSHEIWEYDDLDHIQRLTGLIALCDLCHHVKHLGRANQLVEEGKLDRQEVVNHFLKVNNCDEEVYAVYTDKVFDQWEERSEHEWTVDFGQYEQFVNKK